MGPYPDWLKDRFGNDVPEWAKDRWGDDVSEWEEEYWYDDKDASNEDDDQSLKSAFLRPFFVHLQRKLQKANSIWLRRYFLFSFLLKFQIFY